MKFPFKKDSGSIDFIIVGLGNPGPEYECSRHNMGFLAVEALKDLLSCRGEKLKHKGLSCRAEAGEARLLLVKPQTFMNNSGECIGQVMAFYKIPPERLIVMYDDIDLEAGALRIRKNGGAGTHNGMRSILDTIKTQDFMRIRIGIGKPEHGDLADYVLGRIPKAQQETMQAAVKRAAEAAKCIAIQGIEAAMQKYNG